MSSANTISIRLEVQGTPEVLSQLKSVLTGVNGLQTGLNKAKASMSSGFNVGPLQNLGNAIGQAEQKVSTLKTKLSTLAGEVGRNGAAFGVATASVWGIYNAYDSLAKVEIRAHQAMTRVSTTTTSLAAMEERLRQARESGNLTAEEMAILEDKITNTKQRLAVAQERSADLQGDVNEAWGAFASQIGPQVVAGAGSIAQLVTNIRGSLTGVIPAIRNFASSIGGSITNIFSLRTQSLSAIGPVGAIGPAAMASASGIRVMSGAIKGLLISTGIGAVIAVGATLIEMFMSTTQASGQFATDIQTDFTDAAEGPITYSEKTKTALASATDLIQQYASDTKTNMENATAAYVTSIKQQIEADNLSLKAAQGKTKVLFDSAQKEIDIYDKKFAAQDRNNLLTAEEEKRWKELIPIRNAAADSYETTTKQINSNLGVIKELNPIITQLAEKEQNAANVNEFLTSTSIDSTRAWDAAFESVKKLVDVYVNDMTPAWLKSANGIEVMKTQGKAWIDLQFGTGTENNAVAMEHFNTAVEATFPNQDKLAKNTEKVSKLYDEQLARLKELETKYGIDIPDSLANSETAIDSLTASLEANKEMIDKWKQIAEEFSQVSPSAAKVFKIEFEMDKEVKDFLKDLPKETEKKVKIVVERQEGQKNFQEFFQNIKQIFFREFKTYGTGGELLTAEMGFRPIFNEEDANNFKTELLNKLKELFGKDLETAPDWIKKLVGALNSADTKSEIVTVLKDFGLLVEDELAKIAPTIGTSFWNNLGPLGGIITPLTPEQKANQPKSWEELSNMGKTQSPTDSQITDQTNLQNAIATTQTALSTLATEGGKSLAALAKASSTQMNGFVKNLSVGEVGSQKLQTGLANLSNQGLRSLAALISGAVKAMSGMKSNLSIGEVASQKLQTGLANLSNQGKKSLMALASASSTAMNGFVNNLDKGTEAVEALKDAIAGLKNKTVHIGLTGPGVKFLATGFHGIVDKPTIMVVGEAGAERVDVSPVVGGHTASGLETDRNVRIEPVGKIETSSMKQREIIHERGGIGAGHITLVSYHYLFPNSEAYKKSIQQFSLDNTGMFPSA